MILERYTSARLPAPMRLSMFWSVPLLFASHSIKPHCASPRHDDVFGGVVAEILPVDWRLDVPGRPRSDIVPAFFYAKNNHVGLVAFCKVVLHGLICAVGVADEDSTTARNKRGSHDDNCKRPRHETPRPQPCFNGKKRNS